MRPLLPRLRTFACWENLVFWLLLGLHLLPLWRHRYFLTCDGPAHLYNAALLKTLLLHPHHWAHQLLAINFNPEPNYLSHALLLGLLTVLPPWLADKLVLTLYVAGLPLALRYLLRAVRPDAGWLAVLGFPFIYSVVLLWGFYNFCLSIVVLLWVAGYWLRHTGTWTVRTGLGLAGLLLLLYSAHPLTYLVSGLLLGLLALAKVARQRSWAELGHEAGVLVLAYAPTLPLLGWYLLQKTEAIPSPLEPYIDNLWSWLRLEPIHYFGAAEGSYRWLVMGLISGLGLVASRRMRGGAPGWPALPWLLVGLVLLSAYVLLPDTIAGGSITKPRWGLLSYLVLLGALAAVPYPRWARLVALGVGSVAAGLLLGFRMQRLETFQAGLAEYRSALPYLRPRTTLLALNYGNVEQIPGGPSLGTYLPLFVHASGQLGLEANVFCYENYEALTGYFPLTWRPGKTPLADYTYEVAHLQPMLYEPRYRPTYVLLWGHTAASAPMQQLANAQQIAAYLRYYHYRLRHRSPAGLLELYELPGQPGQR